MVSATTRPSASQFAADAGATGHMSITAVLGALAIFIASINVGGGFAVTYKMLKMFRKEKK